MGVKQFYIIKRKDRLTNGKPTYYCRFREETGEVLPWQSIGEYSKTRAENCAFIYALLPVDFTSMPYTKNKNNKAIVFNFAHRS